jgi:pimeloyl-ACP methyl ester carboxylesterase
MRESMPQAIKSPEQERFEAQYANKEKFIINDAEVEAIDMSPEEPKSDVPVLIAPGWGATIDSFKPGMKTILDRKRRVFSLNHPRVGGIIPKTHDEEMEKYPAEERRKAHTILGLLDQKNIGKADVIAHSEASINVCIAAMLHPEKFRNIVLYSPAGLIGNDSLFRLIKGVVSHPKRPDSISNIPETQEEKDYLASTAHITPEYLKANRTRAYKEVKAISRAHIQKMLEYLREKGIKVVVIGAVDDTFFPMDKLQKNVKSSFVDGFLSVKGGHMQIQVHPELFMGAAEEMIAALEDSKIKQDKAVS